MFKAYRYQNFLSFMSFTRSSVWKKKEVLSPHTWGCTVREGTTIVGKIVVPTHVGVYRRNKRDLFGIQSCPHTRGGVPSTINPKSWIVPLSPHTWGCTGQFLGKVPLIYVVPTHVGVYRFTWTWICLAFSCPHTRGGVPAIEKLRTTIQTLSPHTWGCTEMISVGKRVVTVVPTHVGVYRFGKLNAK